MIFIILKHTCILCSATERPDATSDQHLFALLDIFHPRVAPKQQTPCCSERRHDCYYVIEATWPLTSTVQQPSTDGDGICSVFLCVCIFHLFIFLSHCLSCTISSTLTDKTSKRLLVFRAAAVHFYLWPFL